MIKEAIVKIVNKGDLSYDEAYAVMNEIMSGETTPTQNAAFLAALSTKSACAETTDEIAGCAAAIGHLQNEKGLADLRRAGEEVSPRRQQSVDDRRADAKACFHQLRHGHDLDLSKLLVRFFNLCYTVCACKRGRLLPIWCNRWNRGSRFFFSCHSHLPCSARSSR